MRTFERGESVLVPKCLHPDPTQDGYTHGVVVGPGWKPNIVWVQVWPRSPRWWYTDALKPFPLYENPSWKADRRDYAAELAVVKPDQT